MGAKSKDKVIEILQTGTLRRNEAMADDEHQQVIQLVSSICSLTTRNAGMGFPAV